ncbi:MAG: F0F1 ATP synthase subunit delta [Candidatus Margulisbacteria bacterium]|nr:F0F1 ATP synthase subunit delta [Candidatus Margulisiibacteriota bacterium]
MKEIDVERLYEIAGKDALQMERELFYFSSLLLKQLELKRFLTDSGVAAKNKIAVFEEVYPDCSPRFHALFCFLIDQGLVQRIHWLAQKFSEQVSLKNKTCYLKVTSAERLTEAELDKIRAYAGGNYRFLFELDPGIIGGIRLNWEDGRQIDISLSAALEQLKEAALG